MNTPAQKRRYFVVSDTHFGHDKTWSQFKLSDGETPLRSFANSDEMDQHMIDCWNDTVRDNDVIYHLGDVVINAKNLHKVHALRGVKRLVLGNHDSVVNRVEDYLAAGFEQIYGVTKPAKYPLYLSHIPLHEGCLPEKWCRVNVHGHMHGRRVMMTDQYGVKRVNPRYLCVAVENIRYIPVDLDQIMEYIDGKENDFSARYTWDEGEIKGAEAT